MAANYEFLLSPARLKICAYLAVAGEASFTELKRETGLTDGNLAVQLTKLQAEGFVTPHKKVSEGKRANTYWRLTRFGIEELRKFLNWAKSIANELEKDD